MEEKVWKRPPGSGLLPQELREWMEDFDQDSPLAAAWEALGELMALERRISWDKRYSMAARLDVLFLEVARFCALAWANAQIVPDQLEVWKSIHHGLVWLCENPAQAQGDGQGDGQHQGQ